MLPKFYESEKPMQPVLFTDNVLDISCSHYELRRDVAHSER